MPDSSRSELRFAFQAGALPKKFWHSYGGHKLSGVHGGEVLGQLGTTPFKLRRIYVQGEPADGYRVLVDRPCTSPCRSKLANHRLSFGSVFLPRNEAYALSNGARAWMPDIARDAQQIHPAASWIR